MSPRKKPATPWQTSGLVLGTSRWSDVTNSAPATEISNVSFMRYTFPGWAPISNRCTVNLTYLVTQCQYTVQSVWLLFSGPPRIRTWSTGLPRFSCHPQRTSPSNRQLA